MSTRIALAMYALWCAVTVESLTWHGRQPLQMIVGVAVAIVAICAVRAVPSVEITALAAVIRERTVFRCLCALVIADVVAQTIWGSGSRQDIVISIVQSIFLAGLLVAATRRQVAS